MALVLVLLFLSCKRDAGTNQDILPKKVADSQASPCRHFFGLLHVFMQTVNNSQATYYYSDHSPVAYTSWGTNEPQLHGDDEGCVAIEKYGKWLNKGKNTCRSLTRPFICKHERHKFCTISSLNDRRSSYPKMPTKQRARGGYPLVSFFRD